MSINDEYISVENFASITGLEPSEIEGNFTVEIDGRHLVPRFMVTDQAFSGIAHIELTPDDDPKEDPEADFIIDETIFERFDDENVDGEDVKIKESNSDTSADLQTDNTTDFELYNEPDQVISLKTSHFEAANLKAASKSKKHSGAFSRSELSTLVNPFRRLLARCIDLVWETALVISVTLWLLQTFDNSVRDVFSTPVALLVLVVIVTPFTLILDGIIYSLAGNTPGKWLLSLKVVSRRLKPLSFAQYLYRNFLFWHNSLAYGILPIAIFYVAREGLRVGRGLETRYDQRGQTRVGQKL